MKRNNEFLKQVGKKIRNVRKLRGISYVQLAPKIPMKPESLRKVELGHVSCLLVNLKGIADALDVDIKLFL
jgi:ribosome-binding protein aMBF1 (putative translation factor)